MPGPDILDILVSAPPGGSISIVVAEPDDAPVAVLLPAPMPLEVSIGNVLPGEDGPPGEDGAEGPQGPPGPQIDAILRSAAAGSPNIPGIISFEGVGLGLGLPDPDPSLTRPLNGLLGGKAYWEVYLAGILVRSYHDGTSWVLAADGITYATILSDADDPTGLTGWTLTGGLTTDPVVTYQLPGEVATFIGEPCRVGDSSPYTWYRWDGTVWEETGLAGPQGPAGANGAAGANATTVVLTLAAYLALDAPTQMNGTWYVIPK